MQVDVGVHHSRDNTSNPHRVLPIGLAQVGRSGSKLRTRDFEDLKILE